MDKKKQLQEENEGLRALTKHFKEREEKAQQANRINGNRSQLNIEDGGAQVRSIEVLKEDSTNQGKSINHAAATLKASINVDMSRGGRTPRGGQESGTQSIDNDQYPQHLNGESSLVTLQDMAGQTLFLKGATINQNEQTKSSMEYRNMDAKALESINRFNSSEHNLLNQALQQQNPNLSMLDSLGAQDSIIVENSASQRKTASNMHAKYQNNRQDSLNHMVIKNSMQPHGSSVQITLAESSQLRSNSKHEMQTRREYDVFAAEQSLQTELASSPHLKISGNQAKDKFAKIKQQVTVNRQLQQKVGGKILSNHMYPEDEINIVSKQLSIFSDPQSKEQFFKHIQIAQTKKSNTRNKQRLDFQTTTDLHPTGQLNTIRDHDDPDLTLRTVEGRKNNSSMMSLQNVHKSQGSPITAAKIGYSKANFYGDKHTMAPGFASLPRIDLNKNVNNLSEIFPYNDITKSGKNTRSHTQTKYSKGNIASHAATLKSTLPFKDVNSNAAASVPKLQSHIFDRQNFHGSQQYFRKRNQQLKPHTQLTVSPGGRQNNQPGGSQTTGQFFPKRAPNIKEAILAPLTVNESSDKDKLDFHISQEDLLKLHQGKRASKQFLQNNKEEIQKFIDNVMNSEEKMMGYLEFSNKNMMINDRCHDADAHINEAIKLQQSYDGQGKNSSSVFMQDLTTAKSEQDVSDLQEKIKQKNARYLFDPSNTSKNNKAYMSVIQGRNKERKKGQNVTLDSIGITSKVMETWINETLTDAEHLDIPGCILQPEHKNPITRYGIDRIEMDNCGVPRDFVDRIYRTLFVYSVGFYEMIKNLIKHSNQKYSLVTRIWKVFAVLLEYCCVTDYKMMITQISNQHEQEVEQLKAEFADKLNDCFDNEKILKQNIAALQKSNEDMERERTNERSLRLRLEEEYMQNTKNHEEEVQLRLKFESKLNMMHTQQRETDIKFKRVTEENEELKAYIQVIEAQLKEVKDSNYSRGLELSEKVERLTLLEEQKTIFQKDIASKADQIEKLDNAMRINNKEINESRYSLAQIQNENHKLQMELDMLNQKSTNLITRNEALEKMFDQARQEKQEIQDQSQHLKEQVNTQIVSISQQKQKEVLNSDELKNKRKLLETQKAKITEQNQFLEDLSLIKQSQGAEIEALKEQLAAIRNDFDESAEKLHKTNRYRHELELRYQAEKLTQERIQKTLVEREAIVDEQNRKIINLNEKVLTKEKRISQLQGEVKDLKEDMSTKVNNFNLKINDLKQELFREKNLVEEWNEKFNTADSTLKQTSDTCTDQDQQIRLLNIDRDRLKEKLDSAQETLKTERTEREAEQKKAHDNQLKMQKTQHELKIMLQVSRQLEVQRARQRDEAEARQNELQELIDKLTVRTGMEVEDYLSHLSRYASQYHGLEDKITETEKEHQTDLERHSMRIEDMYRQLFNSENRCQVLEFTIIDLKDKLDMKDDKVSKESNETGQSESKEQTQDDQSEEANQKPNPPGLSVIHETRKSSNAEEQYQEDQTALAAGKTAKESKKQPSTSNSQVNKKPSSLRQESGKAESGRHSTTLNKKDSKASVDTKSKKSQKTSEKDKIRKEFREIGVQVGGGESISLQQLSSQKDMSRGASSHSPSKNEKLVSDLRKTATKNSLLKAKAYKKVGHQDDRKVPLATSFTGFPVAHATQQLQGHLTTDQRSSKSKASSISPARRAEKFQEHKNAEEFLRIESESQRSRFSKTKGGEDTSHLKSQLSNLHESVSSKKEPLSISSRLRAGADNNQDRQSNPKNVQQLSSMVRKDNNVVKTNQLLEEAQNTQMKFAQSTQQTQQRWANKTGSRFGDDRAFGTKTDMNDQSQLMDPDRYQRSQTSQGGLSKDQSKSQSKGLVQGRNPESTSDPHHRQYYSNEPHMKLNVEQDFSSSNNQTAMQGGKSTGMGPMAGQKATNLSSDDHASTIFQHVHNPSTEDQPGQHQIISGQALRQQVKLSKRRDADGNEVQNNNASPSLNKSSNLSTLQGPITMAVDDIGAQPSQPMQSVRAPRLPYAGNSVEHHQHMGQMMGQMVSQLGYDVTSSNPNQQQPLHTIATAQPEGQVANQKKHVPPKNMTQIKALLRGAQSRERIGLGGKR